MGFLAQIRLYFKYRSCLFQWSLSNLDIGQVSSGMHLSFIAVASLRWHDSSFSAVARSVLGRRGDKGEPGLYGPEPSFE